MKTLCEFRSPVRASTVIKEPELRVTFRDRQAHAFSDGDSIHLKLPGGIVSISSNAKQPSGHPFLHVVLARLFG